MCWSLTSFVTRVVGVRVFRRQGPAYCAGVTDAGLAVAVVSSSANTREVLEITGLAEFVQHASTE